MRTDKIKIILATIILFVTIYISNVNAEDSMSFKNIKIDDGLSQSTAEAILQDSRGYIWIGTNDGLNKYNGYDIKIYKSNRNDENTIVSNHIMSIAEDKKGNIWVGTDNGISKINSKDDSIENYLGPINKKLQFYNVQDILITKSGHIMLGTNSGVYLYNDEKNGFERIFEKRVIN